MQEVQIWLLTGVMAVLLGIVGWAAKAAAAGLMKKLDVMIAELRNLTLAEQSGRIQTEANTKSIEKIDCTLEKHDERIQKLERSPFTHTLIPSPNSTEL